MRLFIFTILSGALYFIGLSFSFADDPSMKGSSPDNARMQTVDQELDKVEFFRYGQRAIPQKNEFGLSTEFYWAKFDEPGNFSQKGFLSGYDLDFEHRITDNPKTLINMLGFEAQWAYGKFKQEPDIGPSGIKDYTFDLRGIIGKDLYPTAQMRVTPYIGFGYRYLKDNSEGLDTVVDDFTLLGYKRYSHYDYLPLGAKIVIQTDPNYSWESRLEYDHMFNGWEVDKLGVLPGFSTLVVDENNGNGLRASLRFNMYLKYCTAYAEAFYRYWNIAQSNSKTDPGDPGVGLNEPRNSTQEFGMRLGVQI